MATPRRSGDVSAIFVHAGAGFHSLSNEKNHLEACTNAVQVAMSMLKNGGSAVDAVEVAIMLLEDQEITNAGYGSNLTIQGAVECDATIVDHHGRSGAVGAVPLVKNPISLARVVLEHSTKPLSLQRVPPNFLVGLGATDFAYEKGLVVLPHDALIAPAAKQRWLRWQRDLELADMEEKQRNEARNQTEPHNPLIRRPVPTPASQFLHTPRSMAQVSMDSSPLGPGGLRSHTPSGDASNENLQDDQMVTPETYWNSEQYGSSAINPSQSLDGAVPQASNGRGPGNRMDVDIVTDTVGAIAIDCHGNIAAGSSSGGIGMKHRGRVGPAALVGIGTAVIPVDPNDSERTSVAVVTSGTGEHIATTMAAHTCASRIYNPQRRADDGTYEDIAEDEAMREMIEEDFMGHPGVVNSPCQGAIGIMAVKKTDSGIFLYFGHNTDSFALASMSSEDRQPVCVMSRNNGRGGLAQGGRLCRRKRYRVRDIHTDSASKGVRWLSQYHCPRSRM